MNDLNLFEHFIQSASMSERPAKRIRQACEPCRNVTGRVSIERTPVPVPVPVATPTPSRAQETRLRSSSDVNLEERLKSVEAQLAEVLENQASMSRGASRNISHSPALSHSRQAIGPHVPRLSSSKLPPCEVIASIAKTYLLYCDCQPLPLFYRKGFVETLNERDPEVIFSVLALAIRFSDEEDFRDHQIELITGYVEAARSIISGRIFGGRVELSTLQSLCLLSLVDFTSTSYSSGS
ncbi:hypothetical protein DSL72_005975 [Monilinia vaccinii-corymbosi]|uniref:Transcription factor domain-containing protein n=1 Tax=Monilinia vaccinii-corymbosi TaxID=61207 RepID=A0A8A3PH66_9HELO|nr:hypothetical protein DSL72_005975 [Monilinia vaccinii-corymbosi]